MNTESTTQSTINIGINGAAGRMGRRLIDLAIADECLSLTAAIEPEGSPFAGEDAGLVAGASSCGVAITSLAQLYSAIAPQCVIDFSCNEATGAILDYCLEKSVPLVVATTGLEPEILQRVEDAAARVGIVHAPNMSMAVNLSMKLAETAAGALAGQEDVDVEVIERHHRFKADSPSGTALKFGELIAGKMGQTEHRHGREGVIGARPATEIGYHAVRAGDNPGEHTIIFGMAGETIEIRVAATNRDCYAAGALAAARFLVDRAPGMYSMYDVLGL
ncbi:MAG: 4-hydroxy-tetrahydrodipicolinate reductase [Planctomycetota bacterium]